MINISLNGHHTWNSLSTNPFNFKRKLYIFYEFGFVCWDSDIVSFDELINSKCHAVLSCSGKYIDEIVQAMCDYLAKY